VLEGFEAALERKQRILPPVPKKLDGFQETQIIATCCGSPPEGFGQWSVASDESMSLTGNFAFFEHF
jgi:hypothetical protein